MSDVSFIQLHFLTPYHASLLNRDDVGLAKRIPFGGKSRIRVSSQCLKRHWRTYEGEYSLNSITDEIDQLEMSVRSRRIFKTEIADPLIEEGHNREIVYTAIEQIADKVLGVNIDKKSKTENEDIEIETNQLIILGRPEINYLKNLVRKIVDESDSVNSAKKKSKKIVKDKEMKKNLKALDYASGLDAALFGRMVTSDILARGDAAIHVAHAFTVHGEETETDYFTAVDDLAQEAGELGSGHLNETELASGLYYGYVVIDVPQLISNLEGVSREHWNSVDTDLTSKVIRNLVHTIATVSPGAKLGSTAPYSRANVLIAEVGSSQPRTLANAFLNPVSASDSERNSISALKEHLQRLDRMYKKKEERKIVSIFDVDEEFPADRVESIEEMSNWLRDWIRSN